MYKVVPCTYCTCIENVDEEGGEEEGRGVGLDPLVGGGGEEQGVGEEEGPGGGGLLQDPWELHRLDWLAMI